MPSDVHNAFNEQLEEDQNNEEFDEEFDPGDSGLPVRIYITKPSAGTVVIDATAQEGSIMIDQVSHFNDTKLALSELAEDEYTKRTSYWGPPFQDLDERLNEAFYKYIEELGINDELANFIVEYAQVKESRLYLQSLTNLKDFIAA